MSAMGIGAFAGSGAGDAVPRANNIQVKTNPAKRSKPASRKRNMPAATRTMNHTRPPPLPQPQSRLLTFAFVMSVSVQGVDSSGQGIVEDAAGRGMIGMRLVGQLLKQPIALP